MHTVLPAFLGTTYQIRRIMRKRYDFVLPAPAPGVHTRIRQVITGSPYPRGFAVISNGTHRIVTRTRTTVVTDNATALRTYLVGYPTLLTCQIDLPARLVTQIIALNTLFHFTNLMGVVTKQLIVPRLLRHSFSIRGAATRLLSCLASASRHDTLLSTCSRIQRGLNSINTAAHTTQTVTSLLTRQTWFSYKRPFLSTHFLWGIFID